MQGNQSNATAEARIACLHREHGVPLRRYLTRLATGKTHAAEDLFQETMMRAWRHLDKVPAGADGARRWLFTVARRIAIDSYRAQNARPIEVRLTDFDRRSADDTTESVIAVHLMRDALQSLSPDQRLVLSELYINGYTVDEAAARLGVPAGTVKSRAHYAVRRIRAALTEDG